jgi:hypothetical protein
VACDGMPLKMPGLMKIKTKIKSKKNPSITIELPKLQNISGTTLKVNSMN